MSNVPYYFPALLHCVTEFTQVSYCHTVNKPHTTCHLFVYLHTHPSIHLSPHPSIYPSISPSIHQSICLHVPVDVESCHMTGWAPNRQGASGFGTPPTDKEMKVKAKAKNEFRIQRQQQQPVLWGGVLLVGWWRLGTTQPYTLTYCGSNRRE